MNIRNQAQCMHSCVDMEQSTHLKKFSWRFWFNMAMWEGPELTNPTDTPNLQLNTKQFSQKEIQELVEWLLPHLWMRINPISKWVREADTQSRYKPHPWHGNTQSGRNTQLLSEEWKVCTPHLILQLVDFYLKDGPPKHLTLESMELAFKKSTRL